jgi:CheY-like chemotaxis protein
MNQALKILLIEDNPADVALTQHHLQDAGIKCELKRAGGLFEGIYICLNEEIDLVLLDLTLPDSTGFKTLTTFIERVKTVPVILMTGVFNEIIGNQAVRAGAQDYLVKGQIDGRLLGRSIRYALQRHKEQHRREELLEKLQLSEKLYEEAQALALIGNWQMNIVDNSMIWSDALYHVFEFPINGISPSLSVYLEYVHPEDRHKVTDFFDESTKATRRREISHRLMLSGQKTKYVSLSAQMQLDEVRDVYYLLGVVQDITEKILKELLSPEKLLSRKTGKIREELLADMGFHIRTPLSTIMNLLFLLNEQTTENAEQHELVSDLIISFDDLGGVINNLLNLSILFSEDMKMDANFFHPADTMRNLVKLSKIRCDRVQLQLDVQIDERMPEKISADERKIALLLYNLSALATLNATPQTRLRITSHIEEKYGDTAQMVCELSHGASLAFTKNLQNCYENNHIFNEKEQLPEDKTERLNALAVGIVSKLVSCLQGTLIMTNPTGKIHYFEVRIPINVIRAPKIEHLDKPSSQIRILLVEDHFLNQIATRKLLTSWSEFVTVDIAENGLIAVQKFREYQYDMILMDIQMPIMDGLEATERIRQESATIPIIALTANSTRQEMDACLAKGMNSYLSKPFKPQDLYAHIMAAQGVGIGAHPEALQGH